MTYSIFKMRLNGKYDFHVDIGSGRNSIIKIKLFYIIK